MLPACTYGFIYQVTQGNKCIFLYLEHIVIHNVWDTAFPELIEDIFVVITDDHSRVSLEELKGEPDSDYINSNYVKVGKIKEYGCLLILS